MRVEAGRGRDRGERGLIRAALVALALGAACGKGSPPPTEYVTIVVPYPGAAVEVVEREVVEPLEQALAGLSGLRHLRATSAPDHARLVLTVADHDVTLGAVYERIARVRTVLPAEVVPIVRRGDPEAPDVVYRITGPTPRAELSDVARDLATQLQTLPGVLAAEARGAVVRQVELQLDTARLVAHGITAGEVAAALRHEALHAAGHGLGRGRPVEPRAAELDRLGAIVIAAPGQRGVPLRDLAVVRAITSEPGDVPLELAVHVRSGDAERVVAALEPRLAAATANRPGISVTRAPPRAAGRVVVLRGPDRTILETHGARIAHTLGGSLPAARSEEHIEIDREAAVALQVDPHDIAETVAIVFGRELGELDGVPIMAAKLWDPNALLVRARSGALVPLSALVRRSRAETRARDRVDGQPALIVSVPDRDDLAAAIGELPAGYTAAIERR